MKEILYIILVILLIPIYIIIKVFGTMLRWMFEVTEPMAEAMGEFLDNMAEFWKKIFRKNNSQYKKQ